MNRRLLFLSLSCLAVSCKGLVEPVPDVKPEVSISLSKEQINLDGSTSDYFVADITPAETDFDMSDVTLDVCGADGQTHSPENFRFVSAEPVKGLDNTPQPGRVKINVKEGGKTPYYCDSVYVRINCRLADGSEVSARSPLIRIIGHKFKDVDTGLPKLIVNIPGGKSITSKDYWTGDISFILADKDGNIDYSADVEMKGRGNSTWGSYPKKPYSIRLPERSKLLGMHKHKRWCLLANWMDRTLLRNEFAFEIARCTDLAWTPSGEYVELFLNDRHVGNYYLCESIRIDKNRVDISEEDGQIFVLDTNYDEPYKFYSSSFRMPYNFKVPDDVDTQRYNSQMNFVNAAEKSLYDSKKFAAREFADYFDLESFADWFIVNELTMNYEIKHPKSFYIHRDKEGKLVAGPVWDFDWGTFLPGSTATFCTRDKMYYSRFFNDRAFADILKTRWARYKPQLETVPQSIRQKADILKRSDSFNIALWPINASGTGWPNGDEKMSFSAAVDRMISAYNAKLKWLDAQISML